MMTRNDPGRRREDSDEETEPRWLITRRIDAGHILQTVTMVVAGIVFGVGIYIFVLGRIADHESKLLLLEQQIRANKEYIARVEAGQDKLASEMRLKLDKVLDMVGDIRERQGGAAGNAPRR